MTFSPFNSSLKFLVHEIKRDIYAYDGLFTLCAIVVHRLISQLSEYNLMHNVMLVLFINFKKAYICSIIRLHVRTEGTEKERGKKKICGGKRKDIL